MPSVPISMRCASPPGCRLRRREWWTRWCSTGLVGCRSTPQGISRRCAGCSDPICPVAGSDQFARKLGEKVSYKRWEGFYHETHNEPEKDTVIAAMTDWIESQLS